MKLKYLILVTIAGLIIALDQATKLYIHTHFSLGESITVINDFFNITYVRNTGAAFGFMSTAQETFRNIIFLTMPPVALLVIVMIMRGVHDRDLIQILALSSIFGGAIGNYIDRIRFRYVIDFLDFHIQNEYVWPAFNVADIAIVIGVGILILIMFRKEEPGTEPLPSET
ncbi:MAG: signal peptidase II [Bdellovibrionaceae bacterium]|nr:signal peptidase II [Pseudobdellovibrionaceae bacterium]